MVKSTTDTTGGTQFYSALQKQAMSAVASTFKSILYPVEMPPQGDFPWNWQNANQIFNDTTYQYISACAAAGQTPSSVQLGLGGTYANAYVALLNAMMFSLSSKDQSTLQTAQSNATIQANTVVSDYQTSFGPITDSQLAAAGVTNKVDYVIGYVLGTQWSGATPPLSYSQMKAARNLRSVLPKAPPSADQVLSDVAVYLNLMQPALGLQDQVQNGTWTLSQLKANAMTPTSTNGGIPTFDPNTGATMPGFNDGWSIPAAVSAISNDLQNTTRTIQIDMTTQSASGNSLEVNVKGEVGFSVGSWMRFDTAASGSYDMSRAAGTSTDCSVSISYAGYSLVPVQPTPWQQATNVGFYYADPINQAIANASQDVTGFKFLNPPPYALTSIANGGNFGRVTNLLIANYPTITITYQHADYQTFSQSWSEKVSGNLTLFGFIKLGSFSQGAYGSSFQQGADNSSFSVTFSASPEITSLPQYLKTAYVIGAAVATPSGG